jgi:aromatic-L-amino-acid/L-tryptophan decarboxylase
MTDTEQPASEISLDPTDWDAMRLLAHRMVDDMFAHLESIRDRPVWQPTPQNVSDRFEQALPVHGQNAEQVYQEFLDSILPYQMGNTHPRFWGWYMGNGTMMGALADFLAAVMNPNLAGGNHVANRVEQQVVEWCKDIVGFPKQSSGLLVSGGSMANFVGLAVARNVKSGFDIRVEGLQAVSETMVVYGSSEAHSCLQKAVELLGLGNKNYRHIPVNENYEMDITALEKAIAQDRAAGLKPICVIGNAGTVNTGAVDPLTQLADLCQREQLWFHVDGAIGALAALAPGHKRLVAGIERADSIAMDLHKWMHIPFEAGVALVRNEHDHRFTFSLTPEYLAHAQRGLAGGTNWFSDYGLQLSRGFRALKVWMSLKENGSEKFGLLIDQNISQAHYLAGLVGTQPLLELMAPVVLNIVCFRFNPGKINLETLNALNQELLIRLQESGIAAPSSTVLDGKFCIRAAIVNHRSRKDDFDQLIDTVLRIGNDLVNR